MAWIPKECIMNEQGPERDGDEGSLPLVLLVSIIVAGLVAALFTIVQSGTSSSGRDRDFAQAIHVADAGLQRAYVTLNESFAQGEPPCDEDGNTLQAGVCSGELPSGGNFEWEYERRIGGGWEVLSIGAYGRSTRAIESVVAQDQVLSLAITTITRFVWQGGGNTVVDPPIDIGTYGDADLGESQQARDAINTVWTLGDGPHEVNPPEKAAPGEVDTDHTEDRAAFYCDDREPIDGEDILDDDAGEIRQPDEDDNWCVESLSLQGEWTVAPGDPVVINVMGPPPGNNNPVFRIRTQSSVNDAGDPDDLIVNVSGAYDVDITTNTSSAMHIWAPESRCVFRGSPTFWGTLVCDEVILNGNFHYQDSDEDLSGAETKIQSWIERPAPRQISQD